jgi:hypothetical protein
MWPIAPAQHNAAKLSDVTSANFTVDSFPGLESLSAAGEDLPVSVTFKICRAKHAKGSFIIIFFAANTRSPFARTTADLHFAGIGCSEPERLLRPSCSHSLGGRFLGEAATQLTAPGKLRGAACGRYENVFITAKSCRSLLHSPFCGHKTAFCATSDAGLVCDSDEC